MLAIRNRLPVALLLFSAFAPTLQAEDAIRANPALWQVSDGDTTISLFGTLHLMRPGVEWFHGDIKSTFENADELVLETVEPELAEQQLIVQRVAINTSGQTLRSKLEPDDRSRYENALQSIGIPSNGLDAFKPWMASMTLSVIPMVQAGYRPDVGVDAVLKQAATKNAKPVIGLKEFEQHLRILDSLSEPLQLAMLNNSVQEMHNVRMLVHEMETLWSTGRIDDVGQMMVEGMTGFADSDELYTTLLTDRNRQWADWIEQRMDTPGNVFMAVGAGHLAGPGNLRELLESSGYTVTRVKTKTALAD